MSSCLCDKIAVGDITPNDELVHVKSTHNVHIIGLMVSKDKAKASVPDTKDYVIETKQTFWDAVATGATFGIFSPTTTKYYVKKSDPRVVVLQKNFQSKSYKGYMK